MLLSLNDDCLEIVCMFLTISDQATLACMCQRLKGLIAGIWERNCKEVELDSKTCDYFKENKTVFKFYMRTISTKVQHLKIVDIHENTLYAISSVIFPRVIDLHFVEYIETNDFSDFDFQVIANIFPTLEKFTLHSPNNSGDGIWRLQSLKELELNCKRLKREHLAHTLSELQLHTLSLNAELNKQQRITFLNLDAYVQHENDWDIKKLTNLRKFKLYFSSDDYYFTADRLLYNRTVKTVILNKPFRGYIINLLSIMKMSTMKHLILHEDRFSSEHFVPIGELWGEKFLELRLVASLNNDVDNLLILLEHCTNLEVLDISRNHINLRILKDIIQAVGMRTKPLLMYCFLTLVTDEEVEHLELPQFIKISIDGCFGMFPDEPFVQVEYVNDEQIV